MHQHAPKISLLCPWLCNLPLFSRAVSPPPTLFHSAWGHSFFTSNRLHIETLIGDGDRVDTVLDRGKCGNKGTGFCLKSKLGQGVLRNCWSESTDHWAQNELMGECPDQRSREHLGCKVLEWESSTHKWGLVPDSSYGTSAWWMNIAGAYLGDWSWLVWRIGTLRAEKKSRDFLGVVWGGRGCTRHFEYCEDAFILLIFKYS